MKYFIIALHLFIICSYTSETSAHHPTYSDSIRRSLVFKATTRSKIFNTYNTPECLKTFEKRGKKQLLKNFNNCLSTDIFTDKFKASLIVYNGCPLVSTSRKLNEEQIELIKPYLKAIIRHIYLSKAWHNYFTSRRMLKEIIMLVNKLGLEKQIIKDLVNEILYELNPNIQVDQRAEEN
ncbi:MAG: hypothetical protein P4L22_03625 [Candidatus Babeliales bacterium]|nr:hypothetical protein [Candidatus Babeliales bacterium]